MRKHTVLAAAGLIAGLAFSGTAFATSPAGTWMTESGKTQVKIAPCADAFCGTIVWQKTPSKDVKNPDKSKRGNALVGTQMLFNLKPVGTDAWKGKLYNFENGKNYTGKMELTGGDTLKLSGCVLGGAICKSQQWKKVK
nr:DUF2147 domain-containing protein [Marinicella sp. W31]MDC2876993.1 DUF2147 domain-containing protein [Marinicella sp. W31]